jgi:hypothetical protein
MESSTKPNRLTERPALDEWLDMADDLLEQLEPVYGGREYDREVDIERQLAGR